VAWEALARHGSAVEVVREALEKVDRDLRVRLGSAIS
jgi:hypothetical protein